MTRAKKANMGKAPKVSVVSITYNQEQYIRETLEGFIAQKTNFDFEVVIADDCSTDKTPEIIEQYAQAYPDIFKPILRKKNIGIQANCIDTFQATTGAYIAFCEGDDFWSDPQKLQKQVDFLENNPDYALCFHPVRVFFENKEEKDYVFPAHKDASKFTKLELLKGNFIQSNSVMYRRQEYGDLPNNVMPLDWYLHLYHAQFGKIGFIDKTMSAYRRQNNGVWWTSHKDPGEFWVKQGLGHLALFAEAMKIYGDNADNRKIIESQIMDMFNRLISADRTQGTKKVKEALMGFPDASELFLLKQSESLQYGDVGRADKEKAIWRLLTDLSRSMEATLLVKHSKSFITGYFLLHPWKIPRKVAAEIVHYIERTGLRVKNRKDLRGVNMQYEKVSQTIETHDNIDKKKTAVILHLYYVDLWDYFSEKLRNLDRSKFDLFVSVPSGQESIAATITKEYPSACIVTVPNRGRDVLPFLKIMTILEGQGYEHVLKIHSKKSKHFQGGDSWLKNTINNLLPEQPGLLEEISQKLSNKETGLIGPTEQYISLGVNYEANKASLRGLISEIKSKKVCEKVDLYRFDYGFFAGTMFWARFDAIKDLVNKSNANLFELEQGQIDNTFAHAIERSFSLIPELNDKKMYGINEGQIQQLDYPTNNIPKWSDVYIGPNTNTET